MQVGELKGLSVAACSRIRSGLAEAHAEILGSGADHDSSVRRAALQKVYRLLAQEYHKAGLLSEAQLDESIPQMVYDAAVSAGWQTGSLTPNRSCTLRFGRYWVPANVPHVLRELLQACKWQLRAAWEAEDGSVHAPAQTPRRPRAAAAPSRNNSPEGAPGKSHAAVTERAARRQAVVYPILEAKGWTRSDLVTDAGVGKATVYGYLHGTRARIDRRNRQAIADSLGLDLKDLPD